MRWMLVVLLALLAAVPAQAVSHEDGNDDTPTDGADNGDDVNVDIDNRDTEGAGRDDGDGGMSTPFTVLVVLGLIIVVAVIAALMFAARGRH